jgi:hypothetical protein
VKWLRIDPAWRERGERGERNERNEGKHEDENANETALTPLDFPPPGRIEAAP